MTMAMLPFVMTTFLSPFIIYHQTCNKNKMTSVTSGPGTAYHSGKPC